LTRDEKAFFPTKAVSAGRPIDRSSGTNRPKSASVIFPSASTGTVNVAPFSMYSRSSAGADADVPLGLDLDLLAPRDRERGGHREAGVLLDALHVDGDVLPGLAVGVLVRDADLVAGLPEELVGSVEVLLRRELDLEGGSSPSR
jgi:hypothetical protein